MELGFRKRFALRKFLGEYLGKVKKLVFHVVAPGQKAAPHNLWPLVKTSLEGSVMASIIVL
jgi:hypothetical protein